MNGPMESDAQAQGGFAATWNQMFGDKGQGQGQGHAEDEEPISDLGLALTGGVSTVGDEFGRFVMSRNDDLQGQKPSEAGSLGALGGPNEGGKVATGASAKASGGFLPSQLFDLDQSLYSEQRKGTRM